ncbi:hypothetical protein [Pedobacter caeni]|uniref:Uncharacterized protein n=1 Tax=Pedobacter caeni TaxID=288992 RepID=A0A1M5GY33_9SPHI|nr:hypothetical protein [Pedobacter caeni]SHG08646.1 hypothetical protein SAMN04488522_104419 [Pedobacter caeni]
MKNIDLYKGYEGYGEIVVEEKTLDGIVLFELRMLHFRFDEILSNIPLGEYHPESVMFSYFYLEGWHEDHQPWECKRIPEFYDQLKAIAPLSNVEEQTGLEALIEMSCSAIEKGNKLFITQD